MDADTKNIIALSRLEDALHLARMTAGTAASSSGVASLRSELECVKLTDGGDPVTVAVLRRIIDEARSFLETA